MPEAARSVTVAPLQGAYLAGLQYLRGIAAVMVVFHHARQFVGAGLGVEIGARGVEIFFVISGLVMMLSTRGATIATGRRIRDRIDSAVGFLKRRIARIVPLYWVAIVVCVASSGMCASLRDSTLFLDALFIPHWSVQHPGHVWPTLVPGWSLNYEMFFYLLFGACLLLGHAGASIACVLLVAASALRPFAPPHSALALFLTAPVTWCFVAGVLMYFPLRTAYARRIPDWLLIAAITAGFAWLAMPARLQSPLPTAIACALIVGGAASFRPRRKAGPLLRCMHLLGDASYSIYLFHVPAFEFPRTYLEQIDFGGGYYSVALARYAVLMGFAILTGLLVHLVVERTLIAGARQRLGLQNESPGLTRPANSVPCGHHVT